MIIGFIIFFLVTGQAVHTHLKFEPGEKALVGEQKFIEFENELRKKMATVATESDV